MTLRPTQASIFSQVQRGLRWNLMKLIGAQEQAATGKRILRPSDDATGTAVVLSVRRQLGALGGFLVLPEESTNRSVIRIRLPQPALGRNSR